MAKKATKAAAKSKPVKAAPKKSNKESEETADKSGIDFKAKFSTAWNKKR